ncbi:hypothetical protein WOLCODRAFT_166410 [Wolfiporia cocos MD-104 SS10]|uniref:Uncharacterized protein n=1 Tax=Wolfiporia cocos (strain MD-104) TaxID=742152 RepID=A0A2H3JI44_WOLCO|nr:hypothetical protein WOLCODRAFT_166410 [Wolfiporia cocos MD-104 SS10]
MRWTWVVLSSVRSTITMPPKTSGSLTILIAFGIMAAAGVLTYVLIELRRRRYPPAKGFAVARNDDIPHDYEANPVNDDMRDRSSQDMVSTPLLTPDRRGSDESIRDAGAGWSRPRPPPPGVPPSIAQTGSPAMSSIRPERGGTFEPTPTLASQPSTIPSEPSPFDWQPNLSLLLPYILSTSSEGLSDEPMPSVESSLAPPVPAPDASRKAGRPLPQPPTTSSPMPPSPARSPAPPFPIPPSPARSPAPPSPARSPALPSPARSPAPPTPSPAPPASEQPLLSPTEYFPPTRFSSLSITTGGEQVSPSRFPSYSASGSGSTPRTEHSWLSSAMHGPSPWRGILGGPPPVAEEGEPPMPPIREHAAYHATPEFALAARLSHLALPRPLPSLAGSSSRPLPPPPPP